MANARFTNELLGLTGTKIFVNVQQALPDLIVVSYTFKTKTYQGILLDATKRQLPCGIYPPNGEEYPPPPNLSNKKLFSVKQRHSYFCQDSDIKRGVDVRVRRGGIKRPTVRLRPRQVLCSACSSVCNEKNESVSGTQKKNRLSENSTKYSSSDGKENKVRSTRSFSANNRTIIKGTRRSSRESQQPQQFVSVRTKRKNIDRSLEKINSSLVPKLKKLKPSDIKNAGATIDENKVECESKNPIANKSKCIKNTKNPKVKENTNSVISKKDSKPSQSIVSRTKSSKESISIRTTRSNSSAAISNNNNDNNIKNINELTQLKMILPATVLKPIQNDQNIKGKEEENDIRSKVDSIQKENTSDSKSKQSPCTVPKLTILPFGQKKALACEETDPKLESKVDAANNATMMAPATPLLKICIGPDGNGTIMNISPKVLKDSLAEADEEKESPRKIDQPVASIAAKAARRALKRAKKEAHRKSFLGGSSPLTGNMSPRFGGMSPRRLGGGLSPARLVISGDRFRFNGRSPARFACASPRRLEPISTVRLQSETVLKQNNSNELKKRKRRVKHKKKKKDEKKRRLSSDSGGCSDAATTTLDNIISTKSFIENPNKNADWKPSYSRQNESSCLSGIKSPSKTESRTSPVSSGRHKLSLSIKRVGNENEYVACDSNDSNNTLPKDVSSIVVENKSATKIQLKKHRNLSGGSSTSSHSDDQSEGDIPDFPKTAEERDLSLKFKWRNVDKFLIDLPSTSCQEVTPRYVSVGDVVWGKMLGFPWWPGKVSKLRVLEDMKESSGLKEKESSTTKKREAVVKWFGSTTFSYLDSSHILPFLEFFKQRYTKKKRGPYRSAVKQATVVAETIQERLKTSPENASTSRVIPQSTKKVKKIILQRRNFETNHKLVPEKISSPSSISVGNSFREKISISSNSESREPDSFCKSVNQGLDSSFLRSNDSTNMPQSNFKTLSYTSPDNRDRSIFNHKENPTINVGSVLNDTSLSQYPQFITSKIGQNEDSVLGLIQSLESPEEANDSIGTDENDRTLSRNESNCRLSPCANNYEDKSLKISLTFRSKLNPISREFEVTNSSLPSDRHQERDFYGMSSPPSGRSDYVVSPNGGVSPTSSKLPFWGNISPNNKDDCGFSPKSGPMYGSPAPSIPSSLMPSTSKTPEQNEQNLSLTDEVTENRFTSEESSSTFLFRREKTGFRSLLSERFVPDDGIKVKLEDYSNCDGIYIKSIGDGPNEKVENSLRNSKLVEDEEMNSRTAWLIDGKSHGLTAKDSNSNQDICAKESLDCDVNSFLSEELQNI